MLEKGGWFLLLHPVATREPLDDDFRSAEASPFEAVTYPAPERSPQAIPGPESDDGGQGCRSSQESENWGPSLEEC